MPCKNIGSPPGIQAHPTKIEIPNDSFLNEQTAAQGRLGHKVSEFQQSCDRIVLEKYWVTHARVPKPILEHQGSDSCLNTQTKGVRKTGSFAALKYQANDSRNKQSKAQGRRVLLPPSKVGEFQQSCDRSFGEGLGRPEGHPSQN